MPPVSLRAFHAVAADRDRAAWELWKRPTIPIWQENHEPMRGVGGEATGAMKQGGRGGH